MNALLLATAAGLGLLAFFEPCTIATHTLFAVRTSHDTTRRRWFALAQLLLSSAALLAALFGFAAWLGLESISVSTATTLLGAVGIIYLVSRKIYLPVPHVEFFRLIPEHGRLSQAHKLRLTLPACTLPLAAVVDPLRPGASARYRDARGPCLCGNVFAAHGMGQRPRIQRCASRLSG